MICFRLQMKDMGVLEKVTENFTRRSREILGDNLVGIYLHGSRSEERRVGKECL